MLMTKVQKGIMVLKKFLNIPNHRIVQDIIVILLKQEQCLWAIIIGFIDVMIEVLIVVIFIQNNIIISLIQNIL